MMTFKWDHLHLRSADPAAAAAFYQTVFGASSVSVTRSDDSLRHVVALDGVQLFIDRINAEAPANPTAPHRGVEHFGLLVNDLATVADELRRCGVTFFAEPMLVRPGLQIAFVRGPDNVRIELIERRPA